jgi:hypothetical protein
MQAQDALLLQPPIPRAPDLFRALRSSIPLWNEDVDGRDKSAPRGMCRARLPFGSVSLAEGGSAGDPRPRAA